MAVELSIDDLFREHASSLVRMARFFVDDRNAAEDLVQEAFIRLSRGSDVLGGPKSTESVHCWALHSG